MVETEISYKYNKRIMVETEISNKYQNELWQKQKYHTI